MIKRRKILLFLCLIMSILNVSQVKAFSYSNDGYGSDDSPGSGETGGGNGQNNGASSWTFYQNGSKRIKYRYYIQTGGGFHDEINSLNPIGESDSDTIKAGTWIGIHFYEIQSATWNVTSIEYKEIRRVYKCTKQETSQYCPPYFAGVSGKGEIKYKYSWEADYDKSHCLPSSTTTYETETEKEYYESFSCPFGWTLASTTEKEVDISAGAAGDKSQEVYSLAHSRAAAEVGAPLSKLKIIIDELDEKNEHKTETILGKLVSSSDSGVGKSGSITKTYSYEPNNICINLKTGKVKYNKECKQDEEVEIKPYIQDGIKYWQYFSPLDMKTGSNLSIIKENNNRSISNTICHDMMNKYKNDYQTRMVSINNKALKGDYCKNGNCNNLNTGKGSDWQEVSNGCYLKQTINIDIIQKYYFEEMKNNELKFNGYNLYYRPININNPFPTTPTENSIWYEWFNSTNKTPNLKDSFNEVTYSVAVPNKLADTIRAYNVNNPYPSFDKLSLNGTSSFLQNIGVVSLTEDKLNKLGEGTKTCIKNGTVSIGSDCS